MRLKDPRNGRSAVRTFALVSPIAVLLLVLLALVLFPANETGAADQRNGTGGVENSRNGEGIAPPPGPDAAVGKERIVGAMRDLMSRREFDCEQSARLLLGLDEGEALDSERTVRKLLGIDDREDIDGDQIPRSLGLEEGDEIDCDRIVRWMLGLDDRATIDNERIVRLLLGIDEDDDIDRGQIVEILEDLGEGE